MSFKNFWEYLTMKIMTALRQKVERRNVHV